MVRISTIYDKITEDTTEKVFMVRGDEAYARTTNVVFSLNSNYSKASNGYVLTATVDVLRDVGNSSLTLYDGDEEIQVFNWSSSDNSQTITLPRLSWDITHDLWLRYNGNSQCLGSKSEHIEIVKANPDLTNTSITNNTAKVSYSSTENVSVSVTLHRESGSASLNAREISWYLDDALISTSNTNSTGVASYNYGRLSNGVHRLSAVFDGYSPLGASTYSWDISVGYNISIISYPSIFINGKSNTVKTLVSDNLGNNISGASVSFNNQSSTTDSHGIATFNVTNITNGASYTASYSNNVSSPIIANAVTVLSIDVNSLDTIAGIGDSELLTISLTGTNIQKGIPVTISGHNSVNGTYTTNTDGTVKVNYVGDGNGETILTFNSGNKNFAYIIYDYVAYWSIPSISINEDYRVVYGGSQYVSKTKNGIKIAPPSSQTIGLYQGVGIEQNSWLDADNDYDITFTIADAVSLNSSFGVGFGEYNTSSFNATLFQQSLKIGDKFKIEYRSGNVNVLKNNTSLGTLTVTDGYLFLMFVATRNGDYITLNDLKIIEV